MSDIRSLTSKPFISFKGRGRAKPCYGKQIDCFYFIKSSNNQILFFRTGSKLGISPLMLAAMNGHVTAVKLLLDMGSDVNAQVC